MSAEAVAFTRSWPVGERTATLSARRPQPGTVASVLVEWSPDLPQRLSPAEWTAYTDGRNQALAELAVAFGLSVGVLEA